MITLSSDKINSLLSLPGNNKCLECDNTTVEWVSFPTAVFLCASCGRQHKNFKKAEIVKSLSIFEFTEKEVSKLSIGGNGRYSSLLKEYNIPLSEPNISLIPVSNTSVSIVVTSSPPFVVRVLSPLNL